MCFFASTLSKYPEMYVYANDIYDEREGDTSAEWWGETTIKATIKDRIPVVDVRSQTFWR